MGRNPENLFIFESMNLFLLQARRAHSLSDEVNHYIQEIIDVPWFYVQCILYFYGQSL